MTLRHSSLLNRTDALRYLFWFFWFFLVPAAAAYGLVLWLSASELAGPLDDAAREQSVPAGIVAFTLFEGLLWYFRHRLPFSSPSALGGRSDVPLEQRRELEAAAQLLEEAERLVEQRRRDIVRRYGDAALVELRAALEELAAASRAEPFDPARFDRAHSRASEQTRDKLGNYRKGELREYAESIGVAILVALLLRSVVVEAFKIPSGSMKPTLQINDHIFVSKFSYGPKIPLIDERVFQSLPPKRGDVIVFEFPDINPANERQDYIKRVIAVPGDTLEADSGHPIINGWRVPSCKVGKYVDDDPSVFGQHTGDLYVEFLEGTAYLALYDDHHFAQRQGPYRVGADEVWVMGDNRHNSLDSRAWARKGGGVGAGVPFDNIKGRALIVWFPASRMLVDVMGKPVLPDGAPRALSEGIERCLAQRPAAADTVPPPPFGGTAAH
ncbi:MAG TPA: signal peptidase I [Polyangiaceae bacterium]|nr:signal peptidase I [Polyangiaceae bacterium]